MDALSLSTEFPASRAVAREQTVLHRLADSLIIEFARAIDVSHGVRCVAASLSRAGAVAGTEWWVPAEDSRSFVLEATDGSRVGRRTAIPLGPAGTVVVVGARSCALVEGALGRLVPVIRRRWTDERLAQHASVLARRVEALEDFAALVAHELKAPLQAALLADEAATGASAVLDLVDAVLEAVRCDDSLDDAALSAACLNAAFGDLGPVDAEVVSSLPEHFPLPSAALRLVLRNLLRNAVAAGSARILVWGSSKPERSTLFIDDDGAGLDSADYAAGERLGLSLCHRVLARRGGELELRRRPGGGTRAVLTVPRSWR
jgi:signal transduction histidine kinase